MRDSVYICVIYCIKTGNDSIMKVFKRTAGLILGLFIAVSMVYGQSASEVEMARSMAKQYGYSDSEINAMMSNRGAGAQAGSAGAISQDRSRGAAGKAGQNRQGTQSGNQGMTGTAEMIDINEVPWQIPSRIGFMKEGDQEKFPYRIKYELDTTGNLICKWEEYEIPDKVFGHDLFKSPDLNFVPSYNIPTPANYKFAPGDEIFVDIWGAVYMNYRLEISPDGSIIVPDLGPVYLAGCSVKEAEEIVRQHLSTIYSGMGGDQPNTFMKLSLGKIRSFSINVVGDVEYPGTYTMPSLSTVFAALYMAGGPTELGSLRNIRIYREGRPAVTMDAYDFIFKGDFSKNVRLEDNDLIKVDTYGSRVNIRGAVKRPMTYDVLEGETLSDLLRYAAGFTGDANQSKVQVLRSYGSRRSTFDVSESQFGSFALENGDSVMVVRNISKNRNMVSIEGSVWYPGTYAISDHNNTIKALIEMAGGLREETYMERAVVVRIDEKLDSIQMHFDVNEVMKGNQDIPLVNQDQVRIFSNQELLPKSVITTNGELNEPGEFAYRPGMTLGDAVLISGGYTVAADPSRVNVARRNYYSSSAQKSDTVSVVYSFDLKSQPGAADFELMPYDIVIVRKDPNHAPQISIKVEGEVLYPGTYVVEKNVVRVSDIISRAGGINRDAYLGGCVLERHLTKEEIFRAQKAMKMAQETLKDTTTFENIDLNEAYTIGIDMDEIIRNPGAYGDVILREGDVIKIPKMDNTVKISGGVLNQNVISYRPNYTVKDYIQQAGGYTKKAIRSQVYITYMNGNVATKKSRGGMKALPGCEIIVPVKDKDGKKMSTAEVVSIATSTTSLATMVVSMINVLKK